MEAEMTFLERFKECTNGITHISSGSALRNCRQCCSSDADIGLFGDEDYRQTEPYFSWSCCDTCGSTLGGNREDAHGWYAGGLIHLAICTDCVFYIANGELPDATL